MLGVFVMLNNFFHDFAVALFTCAVLGRGALWRAALGAPAVARPLVEALDRFARRMTVASLVGLVLFGAVRVWGFERFEWIPAVGRAQVPALAAKHVLLASLLLYAVVTALRARARARATPTPTSTT